MSAILCEGIDEDMAFRILNRYFKLKTEMNEILNLVKTYGFKGVEECVVFVTVSSSNTPLNKKDIIKISNISDGTVSTTLLRLAAQKLIRSTTDPTDTSDKALKRLLYSPTPNGVELYEQLKQQLQ